jgi:hypothetical protein
MEKKEAQKERFSILRKLDYSFDSFDIVIGDYLRNGYVDFEKHVDVLRKDDEQVRIQGINQQHRDIWTKYNSNFVITQEEFISQQIEFLKKHLYDLSVRDVAQTVTFIHELDPSHDLYELLERAIDHFLSKLERVDRFDIRNLSLAPELLERIRTKLAKLEPKYPLGETIVALAGSNSWHPDDLSRLDRFSEGDFFEWITAEDKLDVIQLVGEFLARFSSNESARITVDRIQAALARVKSRSQIDRLRVEQLIDRKPGK